MSTEMGNEAETKFCKNCKFSKPDNAMLFGRWRFAKCLADKYPSSSVDYLVTGSRHRDSYFFCSTTRASEICGPNAKMYEPRN